MHHSYIERQSKRTVRGNRNISPFAATLSEGIPGDCALPPSGARFEAVGRRVVDANGWLVGTGCQLGMELSYAVLLGHMAVVVLEKPDSYLVILVRSCCVVGVLRDGHRKTHSGEQEGRQGWKCGEVTHLDASECRLLNRSLAKKGEILLRGCQTTSYV